VSAASSLPGRVTRRSAGNEARRSRPSDTGTPRFGPQPVGGRRAGRDERLWATDSAARSAPTPVRRDPRARDRPLFGRKAYRDEAARPARRPGRNPRSRSADVERETRPNERPAGPRDRDRRR
jgi:hypothetical protein